MTPADFSGPLLSQTNAVYPNSKSLPLLIQPIALALSGWIVNPIFVQIFGVTSGVAGAGTVNGIITSVVGTGLLLPAFQGANFTGSTTPSLALLVENAIRQALVGKSYQGVSAGVGVGTDVITKVVANGAALAGQLQAALSAAKLSGSLTPSFSNALSQGIANLVGTCVGQGTVTGGGNFAAVGTSLSRFA